MKNEYANYNPGFGITCPGGMDARFLRREGNELYWKGRMPYGMETATGWIHYYNIVTDLKGKELRTEER